MTPRHELVLPDLGLKEHSVWASVWLVGEGAAVSEGDRLLEVLCDSATIDLPSPATGVLVEQCVSEGDELHAGQVLGVIEEIYNT